MSKLFYLKDCSSTNDEISQFLLYPNSDFFGIYTFNQKKGRGQYGNQWKTNPNENIAYSLALNIKNVEISDYIFNYYTAIIVRDFLDNLTDNNVLIKWPNDIIVNNKKTVGILIEKKKIDTETYFIIGIGINVLQENFSEISNAGSLFTQTQQRYNLEELANNLHQYLVERYQKTGTQEEILDNFNSNLFRKDKISVFELEGTRQNGIIRNADQFGKISIELESGLRQFYHKEIKLLY